MAPILAGGREAKGAIGGEGVERIADAARAIHREVELIGEDVLIRVRLKDW